MLRSLFSPRPKYLRVFLYENGKPLSADTLHDEQIQHLRLAILEHWKTSPQSAIFFDCVAYEHVSWFKKSRGTEFNIECFLRDSDAITGQRRTRIPEHFMDNLLNTKIGLHPQDTVFRKWKHPIEAEFRLPS